MVLRVKCKCGSPLKVSSAQAGLKLSCPNCGRPFRIPAEKFQVVAEKAKTANAPSPVPEKTHPSSARVPDQALAEPVPVELDIVPANLDSEIPALDLNLAIPTLSAATGARPGEPKGAGSLAHSRSEALDVLDADVAVAPAVIPVQLDSAPTVGYAADASRPTFRASRNVVGDVIQGPKRGFWADAFRSFVYPFCSVNNVVTFIIVAVIATLQVPLAFAGCLGLLGSLIISGWLCAMYFSIIVDTASGSDDLPGIKMEEGFMEDVIKPLFKWIGAFAVALAAPAVLSMLLYYGAVPSSMGYFAPVWFALGIFVIPIYLLVFAFNAPGMILRPDLIVLTIIRTILPYLAVWLLLLFVAIASLIPISGVFLARIGLQSLAFDKTTLGLFGDVFFSVLDVYLSIAAMRLIGLYYLHFKKRFAIAME